MLWFCPRDSPYPIALPLQVAGPHSLYSCLWLLFLVTQAIEGICVCVCVWGGGGGSYYPYQVV